MKGNRIWILVLYFNTYSDILSQQTERQCATNTITYRSVASDNSFTLYLNDMTDSATDAVLYGSNMVLDLNNADSLSLTLPNDQMSFTAIQIQAEFKDLSEGFIIFTREGAGPQSFPMSGGLSQGEGEWQFFDQFIPSVGLQDVLRLGFTVNTEGASLSMRNLNVIGCSDEIIEESPTEPEPMPEPNDTPTQFSAQTGADEITCPVGETKVVINSDTGPEFFFRIRFNGNSLDPAPALQGSNSQLSMRAGAKFRIRRPKMAAWRLMSLCYEINTDMEVFLRAKGKAGYIGMLDKEVFTQDGWHLHTAQIPEGGIEQMKALAITFKWQATILRNVEAVTCISS